MIRFYAAPAWVEGQTAERLEPQGADPELYPAAMKGAEYRDDRPLHLAERLLAEAKSPPIFAQPPNDLPALLRMADQLITLARQEAGEHAKVWKCDCGTRYAVPVALLRPVSIRCERCGRTLDLEIGKSLGDDQLVEPFQGRVNACRKALADFFREAMARGWPVRVTST